MTKQEPEMKTCPKCGEKKLMETNGMTFCMACGEFGGPVVDNFIGVLDNNAKVDREKQVNTILTGWSEPKATPDMPELPLTKTVREYKGKSSVITLTIDSEANSLEAVIANQDSGKATPVTINYGAPGNLEAVLKIVVHHQDDLTPDNALEVLTGDHEAEISG